MAFKKHEREMVYKKLNGKCAYCGEDIKLKDMQIDHIIPQSLFWGNIKSNHKVPSFLSHLGEDDVHHIDNLNPACRVCNNWKNSFDLELFRSEIQEQIKRLNKYSSNYRMAKRYGLVTECSYPITFYFEREGKKFDTPNDQ